MLAVYLLAAWAGLELLGQVLGKELAVWIFAVIGVFVAVGSLKLGNYVESWHRGRKP